MTIALPGYIDKEAWAALLETRHAKKVPNTTYAQKLLLYEVQRIKDAGHDPNAAIKQSVLKGYTDVWPPADKDLRVAVTSDYERTQRLLQEADMQRKESLQSSGPLRRIA